MPIYHYSANEASGRLTSGDIVAASRQEAIKLLRARGLKPKAINEGTGGAFWSLLNRDIGSFLSRKRDALGAFTGEFAMLLNARVNPVEALEILAESGAAEKGGVPIGGLIEAVRGGSALAEAMGRYPHVFPAGYINLVRVGQASGSLPAVMTQLAGQLERRAALRGRITSALVYPALLIATSIGTVILLVTVVLPSFEPVFRQAGADLPLPTRIVLGLSDAVSNYGLLMAVALVAFIAGGWAALRSPERRAARDRLLLRVPVLGSIILHGEMARALRSVATMVSGGLGLRPALAIASDGARNLAIRAALARAGVAVERGQRLSAALAAEKIMPNTVSRLTRVGEESGTLPMVLGNLADLMENKLDQQLTRLTALLTPILTLVVGSIVALILFAILSAVLSVNDLVIQS